MLELKNINYEVSESLKNGKSNIKRILENINFKINENEFIVITGPNGSGKSTLAKIIMGIVKPTSGTIIFNGKDITNLSIEKRAKLGISFAFQQPVRYKGITVKDIIEFSAGKPISINEACDCLARVGLCARDYINREINDKLSGGELKRIEIASVEARNAKLAIFDEPEAGIDLWSFGNLIKVFEKIRTKSKKSTIIISHQERIINIADKVVVLENGKIKKIDTPSKILSSITPSTMCVKGAKANDIE